MRLFARAFQRMSWHTQGMTASAPADFDQPDKDALKALLLQLQGELQQQRETLARQEAELAALEAEFAEQRLKLTEQSEELRTL